MPDESTFAPRDASRPRAARTWRQSAADDLRRHVVRDAVFAACRWRVRAIASRF